jgi:uncharacterized repeat protein (TIGR03803 family)
MLKVNRRYTHCGHLRGGVESKGSSYTTTMKTKPFFRFVATATPLLFLQILFSRPVQAQSNFTLLKSFTNGPDGALPYCTLIDGKDGTFYGTTVAGGISNYGTVFKLSQDASRYGILHYFINTDGSNPYVGLTLGSDGMLYGTTYGGGTSNFGTVFTLAKDGSGFAVLHSFTGGADSKNPEAALVEGSDGALYGTTYFGDSAHRGTIFKLNKDGSGYSVIHSFTGTPDGQQPVSKLLEGSDGALYGTTFFGGAANGGAIYTLQNDGSGYGVLYSFQTSGGDGVAPDAGLLEGSDGVLYGTTYHGGSGQAGTVFAINKDGSGYNILRSFQSTGGDGQRPDNELIEGADGALYGATDYAQGTIFKLNKDGSAYAILRTFVGANGDGNVAKGALVQLANGVLYGTTQRGGNTGPGCVFALSSSPLVPRVLSLSSSSSSNLLRCTGTSAVQHDVLRSTDLSSWSALATLTSQTNGSFQYSDLAPPNPKAFYRLKLH